MQQWMVSWDPQHIAISIEVLSSFLIQQSQAVCKRLDYIKHSDVLHECSAHFSNVLDFCTYAMMEVHLSHKVYLYII